MKRIIIIDGNSLLFRAYYATAFPGAEIMRSQDGTPTNAIFAFSNMMNKILGELKEGESLFVAFDAGKHNFRHDALETYKANRKPAPEDLVVQFPIVRDFLRALNVYQFEEVGFEGDDIAGTVAKLAEKEGYHVNLYTSDRDPQKHPNFYSFSRLRIYRAAIYILFHERDFCRRLAIFSISNQNLSEYS